MSREVRRVPLSFDWPLNKVWEGYIHPTWRECPNPDCDNGQTVGGAWFSAVIYPLLMLNEAATRTDRPIHPWLMELATRPSRLRKGGNPRDYRDYETPRPSADVVALCTGLAGRPASFLGHDSGDQWTMAHKILEAAGLDRDYFRCKVCKGWAIHPDDHEASEAWRRTLPPRGKGWQLWETVSEGSPVTPVFRTAQALVDHLADQQKYRRAAAEQLVKQGSSYGSGALVGGRWLDASKDADILAEQA